MATAPCRENYRERRKATNTPPAAVRLGLEVLKLQKTYGCLLAGPGRGDCSHFVGMPGMLNYPDTIDVYGRPNGWCQVCWDSEKIRKLYENIRKITADFDQSEKENKVYRKIINGLRSKLNEFSADVMNWIDTERDKELGK